jgi:hypothetical protein
MGTPQVADRSRNLEPERVQVIEPQYWMIRAHRRND